ncbi:MAG TPA: BolA family protein [Burkholderiaceae bacterium]|jgi:BolA protein|nr:BolA family protein [Burkholderiaceae bacterium]
MMSRYDRILTRLNETFAPSECQLSDESEAHAGHAGAASGRGHYRLRIVSNRFEGQNRMSRHRLVYDCLGDMMRTDIHALTVTALAPSEVSN